MKKWLVFLIIPILAISIIEPLAYMILNPESGSFFQNIIRFFVYFSGGVIIYTLSPNKNKALAYSYAIILIIFFFYSGISTDGYEYEIMGQPMISEFSLIKELVRTLGLILGIFVAIKINEEKQNQ